MKTREQALEDLRRIVAEQGVILDSLAPEQAAARVFRPGGRSLGALAADFRCTRYRGDAGLLAEKPSTTGEEVAHHDGPVASEHG